MMSHRLGCALADRIAGIAPIGGASGQFDRDLNKYYSCNPARRIPVLHMHATNDRNYPYEGGYGAGLSDTDFYSIDAIDCRLDNKEQCVSGVDHRKRHRDDDLLSIRDASQRGYLQCSRRTLQKRSAGQLRRGE